MRRWLPHAAAIVLFVSFVASGARGLDFGTHWDEQSLVNRVKWSIEHGGTLLPGTYDWPSVSYWLAIGALTPDLVSAAALPSVADMGRRLTERLDDPSYRRRLRQVFLGVTSLALVWAYLAGWLWAGPWTGTAAMGLLAGSWQVAYHARWPAPDGPLVQFVALMLFGAVVSHVRTATIAGPRIAAVAAGLAVGTKYTAGPLAAAWLVSDLVRRLRSSEHAWKPTLRNCGVVIATFLISTPGTVLQPVQFMLSLAYLQRNYNEQASVLAPYLVGAGAPMLAASSSYVGAILWSPWLPVAVSITLLSLYGFATLIRREPSLAVFVVAGPMLLVFAHAMQPILLVRNLLPVAPLIAFAAACGIAALARAAHPRALVPVIVTLVITAHVAFLWHAAWTVGPDSRQSALREFATVASEHCASAALAEAAAAAGVSVTPCTSSPDALLRSEVSLYPPPILNRPRLLGPRDVDALYYPTWLASPHVVILK